ncbi:hypothetical protein BC938DRAFT_478944 [Jimgerdemannia flammicorona]|uniref:Uncharacterized protein n=1 Tax=Jimgerdemannia flammicorona TaxID=994334 RepID=A0A433QLY6_9FUNG|nr:hypothetical protein BC938DRAFT_478944 [Jimgerdemannia flammicorona]
MSICRTPRDASLEEIPESAVSRRRALDQFAHDEGPQQWQKFHGSSHHYTLAHRPEPYSSAC